MKLFAALSIIAFLEGCAGVSPPQHFYTLQARITDVAASGRMTYRVVVAPVTVPELVDRPQFVLRVSPQRVVILEQSRWAESLKGAIAGAVAGNLERLLGDARVGNMNDTADVRVQLDVLAFESQPGIEASIEMAWIVRAGQDKTISGRASEREAVSGSANESLVAAHEQMLARISRKIAADVRLLR